MRFDFASDPYEIQSFILGDTWLEINFVDKADVSADKRVVDVRQRLVDKDLVPEQVEILVQTLTDILEYAHAYRRNPRQTFTVGEDDELPG
jgi:hypothetical protein